jgi:hypothetical protein
MGIGGFCSGIEFRQGGVHEKVGFGLVSAVGVPRELKRLRKKAEGGSFWRFQRGRG